VKSPGFVNYPDSSAILASPWWIIFGSPVLWEQLVEGRTGDNATLVIGSLYVKAKAELAWRFWGLYIHVCKMETLHEADGEKQQSGTGH
jgi:hypothetical protein